MMNPTDQKIVDEVGMIYATAFNHHRPLRRETTLLLKGLEGKKVRASALVPAARRCCTAFGPASVRNMRLHRLLSWPLIDGLPWQTKFNLRPAITHRHCLEMKYELAHHLLVSHQNLTHLIIVIRHFPCACHVCQLTTARGNHMGWSRPLRLPRLPTDACAWQPQGLEAKDVLKDISDSTAPIAAKSLPESV